ncbi:MAG: hypothetical protein ACLQFR_15560 [Streptosporangiaceae bacterium]
MSSDASPPSRIRLDTEPPWTKVIVTTLRLWLRRRVLHVPDHRKVSGLKLAIAGVAVVVVAAAIGGTIAVVDGTSSNPAIHPARHLVVRSGQPPSPAQVEASLNTRSAAAWIAANVSARTVVGCDQVTCADLAAAGFRADAELTGQGALNQLDTDQAVGLRGSMTLIVATPAVRAKYGAQLAARAPVMIASFGSGQNSVQVRQFVPGGTAGYQREARSALAARRKAGRSLAGNRRLFAHGAARLALTSGLVDPRLIAAIRAIARHYPVHLARFGTGGPLAGRWAPLRMAEIGGFTAHGRRGGDLSAIMKLLRGQPAADRPQLVITKLPGGATMLKIEVLAPTPL